MSANPRDRFEWVEVKSDLLRDARRHQGKSKEAVARELGVSTRTYERYERNGRLPAHQLKGIATALGLEFIETDETPRSVFLRKRDEDRLAAVERIARETRSEVMKLRREVATLLATVLRDERESRR